jgi:hypothetical protein
VRAHTTRARSIRCPYCRKEVRESARVCPACRNVLGPYRAPAVQTVEGTPLAESRPRAAPDRSTRLARAAGRRNQTRRSTAGTLLVTMVFLIAAILVVHTVLTGGEGEGVVRSPILLALIFVPLVIGLVYWTMLRR